MASLLLPTVSAALASCISATEFSKKGLSLNKPSKFSMCYELSKHYTDGRGFPRQPRVMDVASF